MKTVFYLGDEIKSYYTLIPENISNKLKLWVKNNNTSSHLEFINKINKRFSDGSYYYNLSPKNKNSMYRTPFIRNKSFVRRKSLYSNSQLPKENTPLLPKVF